MSKLEAYQAENKQHTIAKLKEAMATIEREIRELGYYPHNKGRLTRKELCRRAGVGDSTLKNATHADTANWVRKWLAGLKDSAVAPLPSRADVNEQQLDELRRKFSVLANLFNQSRIECSDLRKDKRDLLKENEDLKLQVGELQIRLASSAGGNIVNFGDRK